MKTETIKEATAKKSLKTAKKAENSDSLGFAVIETGGKQYKVSVGDVLKIEKIKGDYNEGDKVVFENVLLVDNGKDTTNIGDPYLNGAKVEAVIKEKGRNKKVNVIKYKAKSRYFKQRGHRQPYFKVKIEAIK